MTGHFTSYKTWPNHELATMSDDGIDTLLRCRIAFL